MPELQQFNPKLHKQLTEQPELILDLKNIILENEAKGDLSADAEAVEAASEAM